MYNREDIRQVSFLDSITGSRTEFKSLTCINRMFFPWFSDSCIRLLGRIRLGSSTSHVLWTIVPAVCGVQNFFYFSNKLLNVCRFE